MPSRADIPRVALQISRGIVIAPIQVDLEDEVLAQFQQDLLALVHRSGATGVILELSGLETLDSREFESLRRIIEMTRLLGARAVLVGLRPGVVSSLVELGVDIDGLEAALHPDAAFDLLLCAPEEAPAEAPEPEAGEPGGPPEAEAPSRTEPAP